MTISSDRPAYERCAELAEAGKYDEALGAVLAHLKTHPDDGDALNDAGTVLYALGRFDEAIDHLKRAAGRLRETKGQALWNLAEVYLAAGRPTDAMALFDELATQELLTADLANRTAARFLDQGDRAGGIEAILRSLRLSPDQDLLKPIYERARALRPKVAFLCEFPDTKFLRDIHRFVSERFETRVAVGQSAEETLKLMDWCDIAWFEWCTDQVVAASRAPKVCRSIVRLHRFEAFCPWPGEVQWENIDALVTVGNSAVLGRLKQRIPGLAERTRVVEIPNGVDLGRFSFVDRPRGKNLACVAHINLWKQQALLIQAFHKLRSIDPEFRLFLAGEVQDDGVLLEYLKGLVQELDLGGSVCFQGHQDDVAGWLEDKHYLVSGSMVEGHPVNVLEGMARGLKPVIHVFPGVRDFFPDGFLWRTPDEFCQRILSEPYEPAKYREFVAQRYSLEAQLGRVSALLLELEKRPVAKAQRQAADAAVPEVAGKI